MFEFIKKKLYKSYCDIWNGSDIYLKTDNECDLFHLTFYTRIYKTSNGLLLSNSDSTYKFATFEFKLEKNILTFKYQDVSYSFVVTVLSESEYHKELKTLEEKKFEDDILKIKNFKNDIKNVDPKDVFEDLVRKTFDPFTEYFTKSDDETRLIYSTYVCDKLLGIRYNFMAREFTYICSDCPTNFPDYIKSYVESCMFYMKSYNNINFEQLAKISEILRKES